MPSCWSSDVCRSEEHTSELQSHDNLVCRLLLEKKRPSTLRPAAPQCPRRQAGVARVPPPGGGVRGRSRSGRLKLRTGGSVVGVFFLNCAPPPTVSPFPLRAPSPV